MEDKDGEKMEVAKDAEKGEEKEEPAEENEANAEGNDEEAEDDEEAAPEKPQEPEEDAPQDDRPKLAHGKTKLNTRDTTVNVVPSADGRLLMALSDGGLQHYLAGARANVAVKSGRYAFETQLVESVVVSEPAHMRAQGLHGKTLVRIGLSTSGSSLLLGDATTGIYFDSDGHFCHGGHRNRVFSRPLRRGQVMALVVNVDAGSQNANTVSLFVDGRRVGKPQKIPEGLHGKALFPTVAYKGATVRFNLGPQLLKKLPFICRPVADAAVADTDLAPEAEVRREVVVPVGLPGEGPYDFADAFLAKNPSYEELSDRRMAQWARHSGLARPDIGKASEVLASVSPLLDRSFLLMDVKKNLLASERKKAIEPFVGFKKVAIVAMGEPTQEQKEFTQKSLLADKKSKAVAKAKKEAQDRKRKKMFEEQKKKREEVRAAKKQKTDKSDENKGEDKEEEKEAKVEEQNEEKAMEVEDYVEPAVSLDEEEKKQVFRKSQAQDINPDVLARVYAKFTLPDKEEEGFDEIRFSWGSADASSERLRAWILERKRSQKVDSLQPSQWFKDEWSKWQKTVQEWKDSLSKFKKESKDDAVVDDVNISEVEDVKNASNGAPLFSKFKYEDWVLLNLQFELHLLAHAFRKDLNDEDRKTFTLEHAPFYYNKYFKKILSPKTYGMTELTDVLELVKDSVEIDKESMVVGQLPEDAAADGFVKRTEEQRRDRERRTDAGDESAQLKFSKNSSKGEKGRAKGESKGAHHSKGGAKSKGSSKGGKAESRFESRAASKGSSWGSGGKGSKTSKGSGGKGASARPAIGQSSKGRPAAASWASRDAPRRQLARPEPRFAERRFAPSFRR
eukprot:TRINITY_DN632_c0_g3_i1.p1 TRINITY_DN632_c0_g3~~TRINITY_DN632_c0_g3_i1.p1  ORF type:complete len:870 (-),score=177.08 TRINITY_DN632_c0_g3_i1:229-2769(-)